MIQKTKIITLILLGLLFTNLSAQEDNFENDKVAKLADDDRTYRFGLHFSPNVSWLKTNTTNYRSDGSRIGFSYGLSFEYFMTKNYLFSTGINMLQSGGKYSYKGSLDVSDVANIDTHVPADVDVVYKLKYVEIPLLLKLRTNEIGYLTYFGQFGLNMAFNYGAKSEYNYFTTYAGGLGFDNNTNIKDNGASDEINWINLSLVVGAGVEYSISGNTSLALGVTFNNGFINQLDTKVHELNTNGEALIDVDGNPVLSNKNASANLNYIALNVGIYF